MADHLLQQAQIWLISTPLHVLSLTSVSCLILISCIPPLHQPVRKVVRPWVLYHVERGLERVCQVQKFESPALTSAFTLSSTTVSTAFYAIFLPLLVWVGEGQLCHRLSMLMALCIYCGNATKDLVSAPRPFQVSYKSFKPRLVGHSHLELQINSQEYGLPSSHTMNSLVLNCYMIYYLTQFGVVQSYSILLLLYFVAAVWVAWIGLARVYMGLHTPVDILGGVISGLLVLTFYASFDASFERWVLTAPYAVLTHLMACTVLLRLHPKPLVHTPSYEFTASFFGVCWGLIIGLSRCGIPCQTEYRPGASLQLLSTVPGWLLVLKRTLLGLAVIAANKEASKAVLLKLLPLVYWVIPLPIRRLWQPPLHSLAKVHPRKYAGMPLDEKGIPWDVQITARFLSYSSIGLSVTYFLPQLFVLLGLD